MKVQREQGKQQIGARNMGMQCGLLSGEHSI